MEAIVRKSKITVSIYDNMSICEILLTVNNCVNLFSDGTVFARVNSIVFQFQVLTKVKNNTNVRKTFKNVTNPK